MTAGGEEKSEVFLAEVVTSGRVTIPKVVRRKLGIVEGSEVYVRVWTEEKPKQKVGTKEQFYKK